MSNELPPGVSPQELVGLHDRAADWFVRRQQPDWTGADERALDAWLGAHPLHRSIFEGMSRHWHGAPQLRELFPDEFGAAVPPAAPAVCAAPAAAPPRHRVLARWPGRPAAALSVLAVVSLLAWGGWYRWDHTPGYTLQARTAPGQTQSIELPDGSRVALNVDSELQVRYYPRRREVVLDRGEAFFEVTPGPDRPFTVDSGASRVRVVGTAFNVRAGPPRLVVKVLEGKVQLRPERDRAGGDVLLLARAWLWTAPAGTAPWWPMRTAWATGARARCASAARRWRRWRRSCRAIWVRPWSWATSRWAACVSRACWPRPRPSALCARCRP